MATITLQNMRDYIRNFMDVDSTDLTDAIVDSLIRDASQEVESIVRSWTFYEQDFTLQMVSEQNEYIIDDFDGTDDNGNLARLQSMASIVDVHEETRTLEPRAHEWCKNAFPPNFDGATWPPLYWSTWHEHLFLWPTPSFSGLKSLTVRGYREPYDWVSGSASTTIPDLPDRLHLPVQTLALGRAFVHQDDAQMGNYWMALGQQAVQREIDNYNASPKAQPLVIGGGPTLRRTRYFNRLRFPWE